MNSDASSSISESEVKKLCRRAADGENIAIEQLLQLYHRRFSGYVSRKIGVELRGKVDADDILQEAYVDIFAGIKSVTTDHQDSFYRWGLFLIDRAVIERVRHLRRKKRDASREVALQSSSHSKHDDLLERFCRDTTTPSRIARRDEALCALMSAVAQLPEKDRAVVRRLYLEEESPSTVAADLHCTENWVRRIGMRAMERLGRKLKAGRYLSGA